MVIALHSIDGELQLSANQSGWCTVHLLTAGARHHLGADALDVVLTKLSRGLEARLTGGTSGKIEGLDVEWILSLAERHCSVYASDVGDVRVLFFQGADGRLLDKLTLDPVDRRRWLETLMNGRP